MRPQMRVQAVAKAARHEMLRNIAMRDLPQRMHAGVGASRAVDANLLAADRLDPGFQRALHRSAVVLDLPAAERAAVILDDEFVAGHQLNRIGGLSGVPRKNSVAFIGALPARCSSRIRIAPSLQATVRRSSKSWPGVPEPAANSQRRIFTRTASPSIAISHQAPGNGDRPWIWRSTARAGFSQSIRASAFSILVA